MTTAPLPAATDTPHGERAAPHAQKLAQVLQNFAGGCGVAIAIASVQAIAGLSICGALAVARLPGRTRLRRNHVRALADR